MDDDWFDVDDDVSGPHQKVAGIVRGSACSWPECPSDATRVLVFTRDDADGPGWNEATDDPYEAAFHAAFAQGEPVLVLAADLMDRELTRVLATLGATVAGDRLFCGRLHDTTHWPVPCDAVVPLEATGSPEDLARIAADWFEEIMRRSVTGPARRLPGWSFTVPGTALPPGQRWLRNGPDAAA